MATTRVRGPFRGLLSSASRSAAARKDRRLSTRAWQPSFARVVDATALGGAAGGPADTAGPEQPAGLSLLDLSLSHVGDERAGQAASSASASPSASASSPESQTTLVEALGRNGVLRRPDVRAAMQRLDRALFVPLQQDRAAYAEPYENRPVALGGSGATMSTPHHHCVVAEAVAESLAAQKLAQPSRRLRVLDAGCGTGLLTYLFADLLEGIGPQEQELQAQHTAPQVVGTDSVDALLDHARDVARLLPRADTGTDVSAGAVDVGFAAAFDGASGEPVLDVAGGPGAFHVIHVGFALPASSDLARRLIVEALAPGGRVVAPLLFDGLGEDGGLPGAACQELVAIDKDAVTGELTKTVLMRNVLCQEMHAAAFDEEAARRTPAERLQALQDELRAWTKTFKQEHDRTPTKEELSAQPLFRQYGALRRRVWDKHD